MPAHWVPAWLRPHLSALLAPDGRWFLTDSQKRQIGLLRLLLRLPWLLLILAALTVAFAPSRRSDHG